MDLTALKAEIINDPAGLGYAALLPSTPGYVAEILNRAGGGGTMLKTRLITERGILSSYGLGPTAGAAFLDKLDTVAASGLPGTDALSRMMKYIYGNEGVDIGDTASASSLGSLVGVAGITMEEASTVIGMALQPCSRAELLGLGVVMVEHIANCGVI